MKMSFTDRFKKAYFAQSGLVSAAFAFFFAFAMPLQTFRGNSEMFAYGIGDLLPELLVLWAALFAISFAAEILTEPFLGRVACLGFATATVFGYLESCVLSFGLPQLNGELWLLCRPSIRQYLDLWLFAGGTIVLFVCRKRVYGCLHWVALAMLLLGVACIFDAGGQKQKSMEKTAFDDGFCPAFDMVKSTALSTNRNVIVLIVDSVPADIVDSVMASNASLASHFRGFLAFKNNIGMHDTTTRAMPSLITGRYLEKDTGYFDHIGSFWGEDSAIKSFFDANYDLYVRMYVGESYTNHRKYQSPAGNPPGSRFALLRYTNCEPYMTLADIVGFKLMLYRRKHWLIVNAIRAGKRKAYAELKNLTREWELYPLLNEIQISEQPDRPVFCLFHSEGVHIPVPKDGNGSDLQKPDESREAIRDYLPYVLGYVAKFMDHLRELNVYDNSMIVIAADHGILYDAKSTMLWVKPFGAKGAFKSHPAPTSHCRLSDLLKASVRGCPEGDEIISTLSQKIRKTRIRQVSPDKWWQFGRKVDTYDIFFNEDNVETSREDFGEFRVN